jgi:hypothetical protein
MAKVTLSRLFEVSKYMTTEAGKDLKDALEYLSEFVEVVTRNLRGGLTYGDNFNATLKSVTLREGSETVILEGERRRVREVRVRRIVDDTYYILSEFGWRYNPEGNVVVQADFKASDNSSPAATADISVELILYFG